MFSELNELFANNLRILRILRIIPELYPNYSRIFPEFFDILYIIWYFVYKDVILY